MRSGGINWLAVIAAAVAIYAIGFVIYGLLIPAETWMAWEGMTAEDMDAVGSSRDAVQRRDAADECGLHGRHLQMGTGDRTHRTARMGAGIALPSAVPALMYGWVYGIGPAEMTLVD